MPGELAPVLDKSDREKWMQNKIEEHKKSKEKEAAKLAETAAQEKERLWSPYNRAAQFSNELNIAWKGALDIFHWHRILPFKDLVSLRVTGHNLVTIPTELPEALSSLQVLCLISNSIESLPNNIGLLIHLTEIDLTKNRLKTLPDSMCDLTNLTYLNLSCNLLEELPQRFGNLFRLERLWVERNKLKQTPPTFGLLRCHSANLSGNLFTQWELSMAELSNLSTITLNLNQLSSLPDALCTLPSLTSLSVSNNKLKSLPDAFGSLGKLRSLRLDWNQIKELPYSFRHLTALEEIFMEHNPSTMPPPDVVYQGAQVVVSYMHQKFLAWQRQERRNLVEQLQVVLLSLQVQLNNFMANGKNTPEAPWSAVLGCFTPGIDRVVKGTTLSFYALLLPSLYSTLLPVMKQYWDAHPNQRPSLQEVPSDFFELPESAILDAVINYDDEYSTAAVQNQIANFLRCQCVDSETNILKPCNRTPAPYQCERSDVALLRTKMVTAQEYKEMQSDSYLIARRERLANAIKAKCVVYINSEAGIEYFDQIALENAKKYMAALISREKENKQKIKQEKAAALTRKKTLKRIQTLQSKNSRRSIALSKTIDNLQREIDSLSLQLKAAPYAQKKILEARQADLIKRMELSRSNLDSLSNDPKLVKLNSKIAKLDGSSDQGRKVSITTSSEPDSRSEDSSASDDDDDNDSSNSEKDSDEGSLASDVVDTEDDSFMAGLGEIPGLEPIENWIDAATAIIESVLDTRPQKKTHVEELTAMYNEHLRNTYTREKITKVKNKVTTEFYQMRFVLRKWMGFGNRVVFVAWRDYVKETVMTRDTTTRKQHFDEELAAQNRVAEIELGRLEATKWNKKVNPYSDEEYFQHSITGETSICPPPYWDDVQPSQVNMIKLPLIK